MVLVLLGEDGVGSSPVTPARMNQVSGLFSSLPDAADPLWVCSHHRWGGTFGPYKGAGDVMGEKIIAVVGATGTQGGGVARAILNDSSSPFKVRAITRDPESDRAQALAEAGADLAAADLDDFNSVRRAFDGAYGAYCVTFYWEHLSPKKETAHARTMAEAAAHVGVEHAIWSTFEDTRRWVPLDDDRMPTLEGEYKVPHFDAKAEADAAFVELGVPTTFLLTTYYWDNLIHYGRPRRDSDGTLVLNFPMGDKKLAGIASEDIGKCAHGVFRRGSEFIGKTIGIAGEHLTGTQMAESLTRALGEEVRYEPMTHDEYRSTGYTGAEDMGNMFQFYHDFEDDFCAARDPEFARALNPELQTFEQWLEENRIPID